MGGLFHSTLIMNGTTSVERAQAARITRLFCPCFFAVVCRKRVRGADLRNCLAPASAIGDRPDQCFARRFARHLYGRNGTASGSLLLPRLVSARRHPLRVYAALELGIGAIGIGVLFGMPWISQIYNAVGGGGAGGIIVRAVVAAVCLQPPTLLMGATLPAISRWVETSPKDVSCGSVSFTPGILPGRFLAACWRAFTCCACMTWRWRPMWRRRRSTWQSR